MQLTFALFLLSFLTLSCISFHISNTWKRNNLLRAKTERESDFVIALPTDGKTDYVVGEDIPLEIAQQKAIYDMVLVERFSAPEVTKTGLFIPLIEGKDKKHLAKVISVPLSYGLESENGRLNSISEIAPYNVGDLVLIRDPWGIGPMDQQYGQRCFSFIKADHIIGLVK